MMEPKIVFEKLQGRFGDVAFGYTEGGGVKDPFCKVKTEKLVEAALFLRDDPELRFDFLQCATAVDLLKQGLFEVVYHLYSYQHHHSFVVKVDCPRQNPVVPSVVSVWPTADWLEREQFDLLGVQFSGHPSLRRLLLPDDWEGHPMRKDYQLPPGYRGMPTTRPSTLDLLVAFDKANPQAKAVALPAAASAPSPSAAGEASPGGKPQNEKGVA
ncbi:MAG: NADH-quinone oxidoreductase subunit C [Pseudomonadota bacterium]